MVHIATMLKAMGITVQGVDVGDTYITDHLLTAAGITVHTRFDIALPEGVDLVLYSASHQGAHNPLVAQAKQKGVQVMSQAAFLGEFMQVFKNRLAVCGCHGKTTTSSLLAYALPHGAPRPRLSALGSRLDRLFSIEMLHQEGSLASRVICCNHRQTGNNHDQRSLSHLLG